MVLYMYIYFVFMFVSHFSKRTDINHFRHYPVDSSYCFTRDRWTFIYRYSLMEKPWSFGHWSFGPLVLWSCGPVALCSWPHVQAATFSIYFVFHVRACWQPLNILDCTQTELNSHFPGQECHEYNEKLT